MKTPAEESGNSRLKVPARQMFWLNPSDSFIVTIWGARHTTASGRGHSLGCRCPGSEQLTGVPMLTRDPDSQLTTYVLESRYVFPVDYLEQCENPPESYSEVFLVPFL